MQRVTIQRHQDLCDPQPNRIHRDPGSNPSGTDILLGCASLYEEWAVVEVGAALPRIFPGLRSLEVGQPLSKSMDTRRCSHRNHGTGQGVYRFTETFGGRSS